MRIGVSVTTCLGTAPSGQVIRRNIRLTMAVGSIHSLAGAKGDGFGLSRLSRKTQGNKAQDHDQHSDCFFHISFNKNY